jgi:phage shock protein A
MSITSDQIRTVGFIHGLADDAADEIEELEKEVSALKAELDLARAQLEAEYRINSETLSILERIEQKLNVLLDRAAIAKADGEKS